MICIDSGAPRYVISLVTHLHRSRDSSADIVTGYELDGRGSSLGRVKGFLFSIASRPALRPTHSLIPWVLGALSQEVKRPGREADHSSSSSAEVRNGGAIPSLSRKSSWRSA
jgi:hypothetical protein